MVDGVDRDRSRVQSLLVSCNRCARSEDPGVWRAGSFRRIIGRQPELPDMG